MTLSAAPLGVLRPSDIESHEALGIPRELLLAAGVTRVTDHQARQRLGVNRHGDLGGVVYPDLDPETGAERGYRVRRDHPEIENGKPQNKYISSIDRQTLYFVPNCRDALADTTIPMVFVEGEKAALALAAAAQRVDRRLLVVATRGCWGWRGRKGKATDATGARVDEKGPVPDLNRITLTNRKVTICFDANAATNADVERARRAFARELASRGARVRVTDLPSSDPAINGPDDLIATQGDAALFALLDSAKALDEITTKPTKRTQGHIVQLDDPEPWPDPVNGTVLLDTIAACFLRFVVLPASAAPATALWVLHTYALDSAWISPLLAADSPLRRCGKTTLLMILAELVFRALSASSISPAALYRAVERYRPTLLLDEAECWLKQSDELRGLINAGHTRRTAMVIRTVGDQHEPATFSTWCPKFLALIGALPDTLMDRAIVIPMRRKAANERVERLRLDRLPEICLPLRQQAKRWATDHVATLAQADPIIPDALHDRAADNWRPLFAIADAVGGDWPSRARAAALMLSASEPSESANLDVLIDIGAVLRMAHGAEDDEPFEVILDRLGRGEDEISSAELVTKLVSLEDRPWTMWGKVQKPLTQNGLARLLKPFAIAPIKVGPEHKRVSGYRWTAFRDAWLRYLPSQPDSQTAFDKTAAKPCTGNQTADDTLSGCVLPVLATNTGLLSGCPDEIPAPNADEASANIGEATTAAESDIRRDAHRTPIDEQGHGLPHAQIRCGDCGALGCLIPVPHRNGTGHGAPA